MRSRPIFEIFLRSEIETLYNIKREILIFDMFQSVNSFLNYLFLSIFEMEERKLHTL